MPPHWKTPTDLRKAIETSVGQVWTTASKLASITVDTVRQEAEASITAATAERDEALGGGRPSGGAYQ